MQIDDDLRKRVVGLLRKSRSLKSSISERKEALSEIYAVDKEDLNPILKDIAVENHADFEETDLTCDAIDVLMEVDSAGQKEFVEGFLESPNYLVRWSICGVLSVYGDKDSVPLLIDSLLKDDTPLVRLTAAFALEKIGDERALPALHWALEHDEGKDWEDRGMQEYAQYAIDKILKRTGGLNKR